MSKKIVMDEIERLIRTNSHWDVDEKKCIKIKKVGDQAMYLMFSKNCKELQYLMELTEQEDTKGCITYEGTKWCNKEWKGVICVFYRDMYVFDNFILFSLYYDENRIIKLNYRNIDKVTTI